MLYQIAFQFYVLSKRIPGSTDGTLPMGPKYSAGTQKIIAAQIIKGISKQLKHGAFRTEMLNVGHALYTSGTNAISFDDDDFCPPFRFPWPWPWPGPWSYGDLVSLNPQPQPPGYYASVLRLVAASFDEKELSDSLEKLAESAGKL